MLRKSMLFSHTNPPMIVDEIQALARQLDVSTSPPADMKFAYGKSYAGWLVGEIERELDFSPRDCGGQLGERFRRVYRVAVNRVEEDVE